MSKIGRFAKRVVLSIGVLGILAIFTSMSFYGGCTWFSNRIHTPFAISAPDEAIISLEDEAERYFVKVYINGKGPYRLLLDSGCNKTILKKHVIKDLKLTPTKDSFWKYFTPKSKDKMAFYKVDKLKIGEITLNHLIVKNDKNLDESSKKENLDGVLSLSVFYNKLITVDLSKKTLKLSNGHLSKEDNNVIAMRDLHEPHLHPLQLGDFSINFTNNVDVVLPSVRLPYVHNKEKHNIAFYIDTGAQNTGFTILSASADKVQHHKTYDYSRITNFQFYCKKLTTKFAKLKGALLWGDKIELKNPVAEVKDKDTKGIDVNLIGTDFIKKYILVLDPKNHLIQLREHPCDAKSTSLAHSLMDKVNYHQYMTERLYHAAEKYLSLNHTQDNKNQELKSFYAKELLRKYTPDELNELGTIFNDPEIVQVYNAYYKGLIAWGNEGKKTRERLKANIANLHACIKNNKPYTVLEKHDHYGMKLEDDTLLNILKTMDKGGDKNAVDFYKEMVAKHKKEFLMSADMDMIKKHYKSLSDTYLSSVDDLWIYWVLKEDKTLSEESLKKVLALLEKNKTFFQFWVDIYEEGHNQTKLISFIDILFN